MTDTTIRRMIEWFCLSRDTYLRLGIDRLLGILHDQEERKGGLEKYRTLVHVLLCNPGT
jgi:hypothetical protein